MLQLVADPPVGERISVVSSRLTESRSTLRSVRKRRHQIRSLMAAVEIACARAVDAPDWGERLHLTLRDLHQVFAEHAADGHEPNSALQQVVVRRSDLASEVSWLQQEQQRIVTRLAELERRAQSETNPELRFDVGSLLLTLARYRQANADLYYACYCVDITAVADR